MLLLQCVKHIKIISWVFSSLSSQGLCSHLLIFLSWTDRCCVSRLVLLPFLSMTAVCLVIWNGHVNQFVLQYVKPIIFCNFWLNNSSRLTCPEKKFSSPSWWSPNWWKMATKCCSNTKRKQTPPFRQLQYVSECIHITNISHCRILAGRTFSSQRYSWYKCQWVHYWTVCCLLILLVSYSLQCSLAKVVSRGIPPLEEILSLFNTGPMGLFMLPNSSL